jgi:hypothetical protein
MTTNDEFERQLSGWLAEDSARRVPEHLDDVLLRTVATRQRAWWSSLERWLPMDAAIRPWTLVSPGLGRVVLVVALVAALLALLILGVGRGPRLPEPFGLARNGTVVTGVNGDLYSVDLRTGTKTPLLSNSPTDSDFGPIFSRDGTRLVYLRSVLGKGLELVVADADGSNPRPITPAVDGLDQFDWSPDGSRIVYLSRNLGRGQINVVNADGTDPSTIKLPFPANEVSWLPPSGTEILFRGEHLLDKDPPVGIFAIHPDGSGLRSLTLRAPLDDGDYQDISASPSGNLIMYRESGLKGYFRIHVLDLATGSDRVLPTPSTAPAQTGPGFSPDGVRVVYLRVSAGEIFRLVVAPLDGSSVGTELPLRGTLGSDGPTINNYGFTPDGSAVMANDLTSSVEWLLPIDGSAPTVLARGSSPYDALSTIQRLAP